MRRIVWQAVVRNMVVALALTSGVVQAGGPLPYTEEWYQQRADGPAGVRQTYKHGKYWPPFPRAQGPKQPFSQAFHSAHYWPYPYDCQDRADVHTLIDAQTNAGWVLATTLHDYYFDADTQTLTDAGRTQLLHVLNNVPAQYRTVYVAQGTTGDMGQLRAAAVQRYLVETGTPNVPPVVIRPETFAGRPANEVDRLRTLELNSIPRPRLFLIGAAAKQGSGGGGTGGAGAAGGVGAGGSGTGSTTTR